MEKTSPKLRTARFLHRLGISANLLTILGLLLAALSGWLIFQAMHFWAALALLASGLVDMLDGAVARVSGKANAFGGIFDSSLDRYGDAFVFIGLLFYFMGEGKPDLAFLSASAWAGAFEISYVRARAECEIDSCRVGFWERGERIGALTLALAVHNPAAVVWLLGIGTHWTALQRLVAASREDHGLRTPSRTDAAYFIKVVLLVAGLLFIRIP